MRTRSFEETVRARAARDEAFRGALLAEGVDALLAGDMDCGKAILRHYINATIGFDKLAEETGTPAKSLMRILGPRGKPNARNLFSVVHRLQSASGVSLRVRPSR
jgi:DNA-binding phage protein